MSEVEPSAARERVLHTAENLFRTRGYTSVTMRDIAGQLGIKVSSLYYHVPNGKEELYVAIVERNMRRHQRGLQHALREAGEPWQDQLVAAAHWLLDQPSIDMRRFAQMDRHQISAEHASHIMTTMYVTLLQPIEQIFAHAHATIAHELPHPGLLAGTFLSIVDGFQAAPPPDPTFDGVRAASPTDRNITKEHAIDAVLAIFIKGMLAP